MILFIINSLNLALCLFLIWFSVKEKQAGLTVLWSIWAVCEFIFVIYISTML